MIEKYGSAAEARDAHFERDARAQRGLLENQREKAAGERGAVTVRVRFHIRREVEESRSCAGFHSIPVSKSLVTVSGAGVAMAFIVTSRQPATSGCRCVSGLECFVGRICRRFCACGQYGFKFPEKFRDVAPANDERREQAQNMIVRAIDQQAAAQRFLNERRAVNRKIDAEHQSFAADLADEIESRGELFEAGAQFRAARADVCEQFLFFDNGEKFKRGGANQRTAAESRAVHSRRECGGEFLTGDESAERQAACQRLGDGDDIRQRIEFLVREPAAGAAEAALNFISDERGIVLRRQERARCQKSSLTGKMPPSP